MAFRYKMKAMKLNEKGQTSIEYILLLAVIMGIMSNLLPRIREYMIENPNSLQNTVLGGFGNTLEGFNNGFDGKYQRFTLRR